MKIIPKTLKGFRDFLPKEARKRQYAIEILKNVFESYGFEPLQTPALEYEEILLGKYGDEGDKLMYRFEDNGLRRVALRYDQTVPLARVMSQYQNNLPLPFKRYQIQNVWRAENTQKGRFREFLQCDIDIVGEQSISADVEILQIINSCLQKLGFTNYKLLINDRKNFNGIDPSAILTIDKLKKIGDDGAKKELAEKGFDSNLLEQIKSKDATELINTLIKNSEIIGREVTYEPTLARGLDYYTGLIIEVEIEEFDAGSIGGGGRYDNLIGMFENNSIPAIGFAFGFDRLMEAMEKNKLFPQTLTTSKVFVAVPSVGLEKTSIQIGKLLRSRNINSEVFLNNEVSMEKQFKYVEKKEIPFVVIPLSETEAEIRSKSPSGEIMKKVVEISNLPDEIE